MKLHLKATLSKTAAMSYEELTNFEGPCTNEYFLEVVNFVRNKSNPMNQRSHVVICFDMVADQAVDHMKNSDEKNVNDFLEAVWNHDIEVNWGGIDWPKF